MRKIQYDNRTAAFVHDLLKPLAREATYSRIFSLRYMVDDGREFVRAYVSDGKTTIDIDIYDKNRVDIVRAVFDGIES